MFSYPLVFGSGHVIYVEINILKTFQQLEAAIGKGSGR